MPASDTSLWTPEQTILTLAIIGCCLVLAFVRGRADRDGLRKPRRSVRLTKSQDEPSQRDSGSWASAGKVVLAVVLLAVAALLVERGDEPIGVVPDSFSDANVVISGCNYAREGLFAHWGAAQIQTTSDLNPSDPYFLYTRYPVAANLINGLWQILGVTSFRLFRLLPAVCSLGALLVWFSIYRRVAGQAVAVVATITMALSYGFLEYADALHFHAYAMLSSAGTVWSYLKAMAPNERRRLRWFLLTGLLMFVTACFTWEYHLWMVLFIAFYALLFSCPVRRPYLALLVVPLFLALGLQTAQQRLAFAEAYAAEAADADEPKGSPFDDLYRRSLGFEISPDTPIGLTLAGYPKFFLRRYYNFFGLPAVAALAMLLMILMRGRRAPWRIGDWSDGERLVVVLIIAGTGWWCVMPQHTSVHSHVMRQGLAGYALLMSLVWVRCWRMFVSGAFNPAIRAAAAGLALLLCYPELEGTVCSVRVHAENQYLDRRERGGGIYESQAMSRLEKAIPAGSVILTNSRRRPVMRVYSQRPVYWGTSSRIPKDDPENSRIVMELRFNHLRQLYNDELPPLYCAYFSPHGLEAAFRNDPFLRMLLLGGAGERPDAWEAAKRIIRESLRTGRNQGSFCPIVGGDPGILAFDLSPVLPAFRRWWGDMPFPTPHEYGAAE